MEYHDIKTQEQFALMKAKELARLRIRAGKDKYVFGRENSDLAIRIRRWELWTWEKHLDWLNKLEKGGR